MANKIRMHNQVSEMIVVNCDPWENSGVEEQKQLKVQSPPAECQSREAILLEGRQTTVAGRKLLLPVRSFILLQPMDSRPLSSNSVRVEMVEKPSKFTSSKEAVSNALILSTNAHNNHSQVIQPKVSVQTFTCNTCSSVFMSKYSITNHVFSHLEGLMPPPHICKVCGNVFTTLARLKRHLFICQNKKNKAFGKKCLCQKLAGSQCDMCQNNFLQSFNLEKILHKPSNNPLHYQFSQPIVHTPVNDTPKTYKCKISGTSSQITIQGKETESSPKKCERDEKKISYYKNKITYKPFDPKYLPLKCKFCEKLYASNSHLEAHEQLHTGEKPYKCEVCGKCFSYKASLAIHTRTHSGEKPFKCDICGQMFRYNTTLKAHQYTHTGDRPYKCNTCGKSFSFKTTLTIHERIHTGYKPFKCEACGQCFTDSSGLRSHNQTHSGYKQFKCETCSKCFTHSSALKRHSHAHT